MRSVLLPATISMWPNELQFLGSPGSKSLLACSCEAQSSVSTSLSLDGAHILCGGMHVSVHENQNIMVPDLGGARRHVMSCSTRVEEKGGVRLMTIFFVFLFALSCCSLVIWNLLTCIVQTENVTLLTIVHAFGCFQTGVNSSCCHSKQ